MYCNPSFFKFLIYLPQMPLKITENLRSFIIYVHFSLRYWGEKRNKSWARKIMVGDFSAEYADVTIIDIKASNTQILIPFPLSAKNTGLSPPAPYNTSHPATAHNPPNPLPGVRVGGEIIAHRIISCRAGTVFGDKLRLQAPKNLGVAARRHAG